MTTRKTKRSMAQRKRFRNLSKNERARRGQQLGIASAAALTPEQRREKARKAGLAAQAKRRAQQGLEQDPEQITNPDDDDLVL